jgi:hypothetical protein
MTNTLIIYLVLHIILGTLAIVLLTGYLLQITKRNPETKSLKSRSFLAFLSITGSWLFGGLYYTSFYGKSVKPLILSGQLPWIHKIIMETKEHIFLFLPFSTLAIFAISYFFQEKLKNDQRLRIATTALCFTTVSVALAVLIFGMIISGAVKK